MRLDMQLSLMAVKSVIKVRRVFIFSKRDNGLGMLDEWNGVDIAVCML